MNDYYVRPSHEYRSSSIRMPGGDFLYDAGLDYLTDVAGSYLGSYGSRKLRDAFRYYGYDPWGRTSNALQYATRRAAGRAARATRNYIRPRKMTRGTRAYQRRAQSRIRFGGRRAFGRASYRPAYRRFRFARPYRARRRRRF